MKEYENEINKLREKLDALEKSIKERPEPQLEVGKSYKNSTGSQYVINRKGDTHNYGFVGGHWFDRMACSDPGSWQEIPESEAIALLEKECVRRYGKNWEDAKIKLCANIRMQVISVNIDQIWNRNACIFKNGVWAEKLEEAELKH